MNNVRDIRSPRIPPRTAITPRRRRFHQRHMQRSCEDNGTPFRRHAPDGSPRIFDTAAVCEGCLRRRTGSRQTRMTWFKASSSSGSSLPPSSSPSRLPPVSPSLQLMSICFLTHPPPPLSLCLPPAILPRPGHHDSHRSPRRPSLDFFPTAWCC